MPYQTQASVVLQRWRAVEAALLDVAEGSPDAEALQSEALRLRDEYQELVERSRDAHKPEPPPFPESAG